MQASLMKSYTKQRFLNNCCRNDYRRLGPYYACYYNKMIFKCIIYFQKNINGTRLFGKKYCRLKISHIYIQH